jgi:hypothetical protein
VAAVYAAAAAVVVAVVVVVVVAVIIVVPAVFQLLLAVDVVGVAIPQGIHAATGAADSAIASMISCMLFPLLLLLPLLPSSLLLQPGAVRVVSTAALLS